MSDPRRTTEVLPVSRIPSAISGIRVPSSGVLPHLRCAHCQTDVSGDITPQVVGRTDRYGDYTLVREMPDIAAAPDGPDRLYRVTVTDVLVDGVKKNYSHVVTILCRGEVRPVPWLPPVRAGISTRVLHQSPVWRYSASILAWMTPSR